MIYEHCAISDAVIPQAVDATFQHVLDIYAGETNKVASTWLEFCEADLAYKPHPKSSTVAEILKHQLLSERRFFAEFLGTSEPAPADVVPAEITPASCTHRLVQLAKRRLDFLASRDMDWWMTTAKFFDVERQRIWIFWRCVLHTAHHRTQLTQYLRLLEKPVPSTYGPTADVTWIGADPTNTVDAAGRR